MIEITGIQIKSTN